MDDCDPRPDRWDGSWDERKLLVVPRHTSPSTVDTPPARMLPSHILDSARDLWNRPIEDSWWWFTTYLWSIYTASLSDWTPRQAYK